MADIRLDDGTINVDGEWLSVKDLIKQIQEKVDAKDVKLKKLVSALEELTTAIENYHEIGHQATDPLIGIADEKEPTSLGDRIFDIISGTSEEEQKELLKDFEDRQLNKVRRHPRKECLLKANYTTKGKAHQNFIKNISVAGAFIETKEVFFVGEEILLTIFYSNDHRPFKISGEVTRIDSKGVGVKFKNVSKVQEVMINSIIQKPDII